MGRIIDWFRPNNKVVLLKEYIKARVSNRNEDDWDEFSAAITNTLMQFNKKEQYQLSTDVIYWKDEVAVKLAYPLIYAITDHFPIRERMITYGTVFLKVKDPDMQRFMLPNIHFIVCIFPGQVLPTFYTKIRKRVSDLTNGNYKHLALLDEKIRLEERGKVFKGEIPRSITRMNNLHYPTDNIKKLIDYLKKNEDDINDSWYYVHNPVIIAHINEFSKEECARLEESMISWDDMMLYNFADAAAESENPFLDGSAIYCDICLRLNDPEDLRYLMDNFPPYFSSIRPGSRPISFYEAIRKKCSAFGFHYFLTLIDDKIEQEKALGKSE